MYVNTLATSYAALQQPILRPEFENKKTWHNQLKATSLKCPETFKRMVAFESMQGLQTLLPAPLNKSRLLTFFRLNSKNSHLKESR